MSLLCNIEVGSSVWLLTRKASSSIKVSELYLILSLDCHVWVMLLHWEEQLKAVGWISEMTDNLMQRQWPLEELQPSLHLLALKLVCRQCFQTKTVNLRVFALFLYWDTQKKIESLCHFSIINLKVKLGRIRLIIVVPAWEHSPMERPKIQIPGPKNWTRETGTYSTFPTSLTHQNYLSHFWNFNTLSQCIHQETLYWLINYA